MDCINKVTQTFGKVSRGIHLRLQHLLGKKLEEIQQFQDNGYQSTRISDSVPPYGKLTSIEISDLVPPSRKMTAIDVGQYNILNKRNDY